VADISAAVAAAINDDDNLPVTAVDNGDGTVTITSKSGGTWGNGITLAVILAEGESLPDGVACTITAMTGGSGVPDIQDALDALGTGDGQNDKGFTNLIHGYGGDTGTLDKISSYNGTGNDYVGNYKKEVAKPFRSLYGDTTAGSAGKTALIAVAALRKNDRTNGVLAAPGEYYHPQELAASAVGLMAVKNSKIAQEGYANRVFGTSFAAVADRWTNDYDDRDYAVSNGVGTTMVKNGNLTFQNLITFYHPDDVDPESNGYRDMEDIARTQNILANIRARFETEKWTGCFIVEDVATVTDVDAKEKARDVGTVIDELIALADEFAGLGWIYQDDYTKKNLTVTLRAGLTGFDNYFPVIYSGNVNILNTDIVFDTSIAVLIS
jgi:phage tail sheath gpL-like